MIGVILDFPGATLEQHDAAITGMGYAPGGEGQCDCLFHWVAKTDDGIRVVNVWTSREAFDQNGHGGVRSSGPRSGSSAAQDQLLRRAHDAQEPGSLSPANLAAPPVKHAVAVGPGLRDYQEAHGAAPRPRRYSDSPATSSVAWRPDLARLPQRR